MSRCIPIARIGWPTAVLAAVTALAACAGAQQAEEPLPTGGPATVAPAPSSRPPRTLPPPPGAALVVVRSRPSADASRRAVFADYVTFWQRNMVALTTNEVNGSGVIDYLASPQLDATVTSLVDRRSRGVRNQGVLRIAPQVASVQGQAALLRDCLDQAGMVEVARAGRRTRLTPKVAMSVRLTRGSDGRWRVSELIQQSSPSCR
jgi:hypothetical protein